MILLYMFMLDVIISVIIAVKQVCKWCNIKVK